MNEPTINQLVIRDPDYENSYVTDGSINTIEIDIGGQWESYKQFVSDLIEGDAGALDYEQSIMAEVEHLPDDSRVKAAAKEFFQQARDYYT